MCANVMRWFVIAAELFNRAKCFLILTNHCYCSIDIMPPEIDDSIYRSNETSEYYTDIVVEGGSERGFMVIYCGLYKTKNAMRILLASNWNVLHSREKSLWALKIISSSSPTEFNSDNLVIWNRLRNKHKIIFIFFLLQWENVDLNSRIVSNVHFISRRLLSHNLVEKCL